MLALPTDLDNEDVETREKKQNKLNKYCMGKAFKAFHQRYMHLFPIFSGIMLQPERYSSDIALPSNITTVTRLSNSLVEGWFRIVKHDTLQKKKRLSVGPFIRKLHKVLRGRLRRFILDTVPQKSRKKPVELSEETWTPKKSNLPHIPPASRYYSTPNVAPMPKQKKQTPVAKQKTPTTCWMSRNYWCVCC
jgi:hypothetical protein